MKKMTHHLTLVSLGLALCFGSANLWAQSAANYPDKPVKVIIPFPPGGTLDKIGRMLALKMGEQLGQNFVVENRPGVPGMMAGKEALPDGYTLTFGTSGTLAVNPAVYSKLTYDTQRDFAMIHGGGVIPMVIVASATSPFQSLKDLVDAARKEPGKYNIGYGGVNNTQHLTGELFKSYAKVDLVGVTYKGSAAAVTDLLGGQVSLLVDSLAATMPHIKSGKIRPLAISTLQRVPQMPDLPTVAESGYKYFEADQWYGVVAPAGTPRDIVTKLNQQINLALNGAELKKRLNTEGAVAMPETPEVFGNLIVQEIERWRPVITSGRVKVD